MPGHRLIIAEKPSVARDIAKVLGANRRAEGWIDGGDTRVTWCVGHLVELADPQSYNKDWRSWRMDTLPMLPESFRLKTRNDANDQWHVVKAQLNEPGLTEVINACDAGREGELIFAYVFELAGCKAPVRRLWISSMTDGAIRAGFDDLRQGERYADLESAARCRSEADWLVGLNATRAMTTSLRSGPEGSLLSVGRVQTPTLALLADREDEIEAFVVEDFWQIKVRFAAPSIGPASGEWESSWLAPRKRGTKRADRFTDHDAAQAVMDRISGLPGRVARVDHEKKRERPPLLHDLTALQKDANRRFRYTAKQTLEIAQSLYERHKLITYPRTDSRHLGADQREGLPARIRGIDFGPYTDVAQSTLARWPIKLGKRVIDDAEVSDHHALVPTGVDPRSCSLSEAEKRIFDLVARRFLAVFQADAVFATATVETIIDSVSPEGQNTADHFTARGRTCLEPGWQDIDPPAAARKAKKGKGKAEVILPPVTVGDVAEQRSATLHKGQTKPPRRYSEATLLAAMETAGQAIDDAELKRAMKRRGLGTPATRAAVIETLVARRYIGRESNNLVPTDHGRAMLRALPVEGLRSARLTGEWEARLNAMAEGRDDRAAFMADIRKFTAELVEAIRAAEFSTSVRAALAPAAPDGAVVGQCPRCQAEVRAAARGWGCTSCSVYIANLVARRDISLTLARSLLKDGQTKVIKGFKSRAGKTFSAALRLGQDGRVAFEFPEPDPLGSCPACGKPVRQRGSIFTCDTGRECPFVIFADMRGAAMTEARVRGLLADGRSELISDFKRRDETTYSGRLVFENGRVVVIQEREEPPSRD